MKQSVFQLALIVLVIFSACAGKKSGSESEVVIKSNESLNSMLAELKNKFSETTSFQSIIFSFDEVMGNNMMVKVATNIDSAKIQNWFYFGGKWNLTSEEVYKNDSLKISESFFNFKSDYQTSLLSQLMSTTYEKLESEKQVKNFTFKSINLLMGKQTAKKDKMEKLITQLSVETPEQKQFFINFDNKGNFRSISE
jgi:hypothetical protein